MDEVETKLSAARTRLILDKPFLGALVLRLPMVAADPQWCQTTATDARSFYYNHDYVDALNLDQAQFVLAHEALHCALSHFARRQHRIKRNWDIACDLAVNPLLIGEGLTPPPGALLLEGFDGMTAEEIYPFIDDNFDDEPMDQHVYDEPQDSRGQGGGGHGETSQSRSVQEQQPDRRSETEPDATSGGAPQPPPLTGPERDNLSVQWQQRLAGAAQQAMQAGKLSGAMARLVDHLLQPRLPWRMLLARYMTAVARDDYTYARPSRREGSAILPSLRSSQVELTVVVDTSGSVSADEVNQFLSEVNAIKGQMRARITLHACDAALNSQGPWQFEPWEEAALPETLQGGGGTDFRPAFAWADRLDRQPDLLLYFTDAEGEFPETPPAYPVLWLVKGKATVPWASGCS